MAGTRIGKFLPGFLILLQISRDQSNLTVTWILGLFGHQI